MAVVIGVDPHKGSHTAVALDHAEKLLGELKVRSSPGQVDRLRWAAQWPERTWAIEGAGGLGYPLAQQLVAVGETVLDVQPKLGPGCGCWPPATSTRTTPTTPARWPSSPSGQKACARWRLKTMPRC